MGIHRKFVIILVFAFAFNSWAQQGVIHVDEDHTNHKITNVSHPPVNDHDAATKKYVDDLVGGATTFLDLTDTPSSYSGQAGKVVAVKESEDGLEFISSSGGSIVSSIGFTNDGAGSVVLTGVKGYFTIAYNCTITGWSIAAAGSSPTCTIDVWKIATGTALPTVTNTITASAKPALATGNAVRSSTLTGWTTSVSAGDIFGYNLDAVANATKLTFELELTR